MKKNTIINIMLTWIHAYYFSFSHIMIIQNNRYIELWHLKVSANESWPKYKIKKLLLFTCIYILLSVSHLHSTCLNPSLTPHLSPLNSCWCHTDSSCTGCRGSPSHISEKERKEFPEMLSYLWTRGHCLHVFMAAVCGTWHPSHGRAKTSDPNRLGPRLA